MINAAQLGPRPEFAINHVTALAITQPLGGSVHKSLSRFGLLAEGFNGLRLQSIGLKPDLANVESWQEFRCLFEAFKETKVPNAGGRTDQDSSQW